MNVSSVSILICSYNRADFLKDTLDALLQVPHRDDYALEILVVDNNSTDGTRRVVEDAAATATTPVRYAFETRQGKSFALNLGMQLAQSDVVAHTDDDVWPEPGWTDRIVDAFRAHDITFAFGKVLPRWGTTPPPDLLTKRAHDVWGPLAILDYGDEPLSYSVEKTGQKLPVGANLSFRRQTLLDIGGWRTDLGRVDNTLISGEDHEIFIRLKRLNCYRGLYDPEMTVRHYVPSSRLTREYFRRWFYWHGKTMARMPDEIYDLDFQQVPHVFGAPRFLYRQFLQQCGKYLKRVGRRDALGVLIEELQAIEYLGFFLQSWQWWLKGEGREAARTEPPALVAAGAGDELATASDRRVPS